MSAVLDNATEARQLASHYSLQAYYDGVTGLPNSVLFMDRLSHALLGAHRRGSGVAVLVLEIAGEGVVGATSAQDGRAMLLKRIGERLEGCLRPNDTIARLNGYEFLALLEDIHRPADATFVAERIANALRTPFSVGEAQVVVAPAIGIATRTPAVLQDLPDNLVLEAARAARLARRSGTAHALVSGDIIDATATPDSPCAQ